MPASPADLRYSPLALGLVPSRLNWSWREGSSSGSSGFHSWVVGEGLKLNRKGERAGKANMEQNTLSKASTSRKQANDSLLVRESESRLSWITHWEIWVLCKKFGTQHSNTHGDYYPFSNLSDSLQSHRL